MFVHGLSYLLERFPGLRKKVIGVKIKMALIIGILWEVRLAQGHHTQSLPDFAARRERSESRSVSVSLSLSRKKETMAEILPL